MRRIGGSGIGFVFVCALGASPAFATTVTPSRTATRTCTPGANPPPGCAYEGPTFTHTKTTPTPTETAGGGFRICGRAGERPVPNPPLARYVLFSLEPLGRNVFSTAAGFFCFENVPPGNYTISVREYVGAPSHCTEYGCWETTPVGVVDSDVLNVFIVMRPAPTPTPTPTMTGTRTCQPAAPPRTCGPGEGRVCEDEQCVVGCSCALTTPTSSPIPTTTCPPVLPPPDCATGDNLTCFEYRCGFGCACACAGDCNLNAIVSVDELITAVRIALDGAPATACLSAVCDCSPGSACAAGVRIDCLVRAVTRALEGCAPRAIPTPTPPHVESCDPVLNGPSDGPRPGEQVVFHLTDESTITLPDGSVESLRGSLLASSCFSPNSFFAARVETLRFVSDFVIVESGCAAIGRVVASTLYGGETPVEFSSAVRVDGALLTLAGRGPHFAMPTAIRLDFQLVADSYRVHLVAVGDVILNPGSEWPSCIEWGFA